MDLGEPKLAKPPIHILHPKRCLMGVVTVNQAIYCCRHKEKVELKQCIKERCGCDKPLTVSCKKCNDYIDSVEIKRFYKECDK